MSLVNKITKSFRWLRWSTLLAILFYAFFIGLMLHNTTLKVQDTLKTKKQPSEQQNHLHLQQQQQEQPDQDQEQKQRQHHHDSSSSSGNNALRAPTNKKASLAATLQNMRGRSVAEADRLRTAASAELPPSLAVAVAAAAAAPSDARTPPARTTSTLHGGRTNRKVVEPETVILAAGTVNEKQILAKAFRRADKNHDQLLTIRELAVFINAKIIEHIDWAIGNNPKEFRRVDVSPPDGVISWEEYYTFFLSEHNLSETEDVDTHGEIKHTAANRRAREDMARDKARWSEAARTDLFSLTIDEYLSFRHPESSVTNLLELVDDLLRQFDQDGDDQLTIEEFSEVNVDDNEDLRRKALISRTVIERHEEFKRIIDKNADGKADRGELLNYVNPRTPRYALQEASTLFSLCDENKDGKLTLKEMLANAEIFLTSKMIDTANSFHQDF